MKTIEELNEMSVRQINDYMRSIDESGKWPVLGRFNVTERAIRRVRKLKHDGLDVACGYEYYLTLENEIARIVNEL